MTRPLVKVCGVTRVEDALEAVRLGADFLGLNFWPRSPRFVTLAAARELADAVRGRCTLVGVFVDAAAAEVAATAARIGLDLVQLHGDEPAAIASQLAELGAPRVLRAVRGATRPTAVDLESWPTAWGFLFDRYDPVRYGGTGEGWDVSVLADLPRQRPLLAAGGVRPGRVRAILESSRAHGIDVCSGVESAPGIKDHDAMARLFAEVRDVPIAAPA